MSESFCDVTNPDILEFAAAHPLVWIVPVADPSAALLMPVLIEKGDDGEPSTILGHLPKRAAAVSALARDGASTFLFLGPNAYIPPGWVSQEDWAPTWNFLSLKITADKTTVDPGLTRTAVESLVQHMEAHAGSGWTVERIGPRYESMLDAIIGFRSHVTRIEPRFKIGQDESATVREEIRQALGAHPLGKWMD